METTRRSRDRKTTTGIIRHLDELGRIVIPIESDQQRLYVDGTSERRRNATGAIQLAAQIPLGRRRREARQREGSNFRRAGRGAQLDSSDGEEHRLSGQIPESSGGIRHTRTGRRGVMNAGRTSRPEGTRQFPGLFVVSASGGETRSDPERTLSSGYPKR